MGMAASQARLLTLTARIHDVEYEAQALQNAKVELSTQSDRVYEDYLEALDATTLTVLQMDKAGNKSTVTATFNNLCSANKVQTANGNDYALFDYRGRLIVSEDVYDKYESFDPGPGDYNNAATFAMHAMGIAIDNEAGESLSDSEEGIYNEIIKNRDGNSTLEQYYKTTFDLLEKICEKYELGTPISIFDDNGIFSSGRVSEEDKKLYKNALLTFRMELYQEAGEKIYDNAVGKGLVNEHYKSSESFDYATFQYYASIYGQIQKAGGCVCIDEFNNGDSNSNAANDSEWLKAMIECGKITMAQVETDSKTKEVTFDATSPSSDDVISYTQTTEIDKTALAKAEAEYEHAMSNINKKDEKFDLELSKLESERTALTTEYDSVKKVIEDNIDRTFGIFS